MRFGRLAAMFLVFSTGTQAQTTNQNLFPGWGRGGSTFSSSNGDVTLGPGVVVSRKYVRRYLDPPSGVKSDAAQAVTVAGRIYGVWIDVPEDSEVIGIGYMVSGTAGNARAALYGPVSALTMAGAPLVVESASVAVGIGPAGQVIPLSTTSIGRGWYYMAIAFSSTSASYYRSNAANKWEPGLIQTLTTDQAFGAFPNPAGPMTSNTGASPVMSLVRQ